MEVEESISTSSDRSQGHALNAIVKTEGFAVDGEVGVLFFRVEQRVVDDPRSAVAIVVNHELESLSVGAVDVRVNATVRSTAYVDTQSDEQRSVLILLPRESVSFDQSVGFQGKYKQLRWTNLIFLILSRIQYPESVARVHLYIYRNKQKVINYYLICFFF